jgi:uncharacterized protein YfdQ (DUF2303 family)
MNEQDESNVAKNMVESALDAACAPETAEIDQTPFLLLPPGWTAQERADLLRVPVRPKGTVLLEDSASFCAYVKALGFSDNNVTTRIYCTPPDERRPGGTRFVAVLNDHADGQSGAGWRDLRAVFEPRVSEEWKRWTHHNRRTMGQAEFALFVEDNMRDIADVEGMPNGTQMLELALNLEANSDARFRSGVRLQSGGVDLVYVDKEDDETLKKMRLFERFALGVAPFFNGVAYRQDARLRYRVKDGTATFWYELIRPDITLMDAIRALAATVGQQTELPLLYGRPDEA